MPITLTAISGKHTQRPFMPYGNSFIRGEIATKRLLRKPSRCLVQARPRRPRARLSLVC
jgi:hypothetical protein